MQVKAGQAAIMVSRKLTKEATAKGINLRLVAEAAIKRAMQKREFLKRSNAIFKNSRLTGADALRLGRKASAALARRYAVR
ncbi:MAG: hypothetical protein M1286_02930 [Candidatus Marsarchaeota archaeon]|nr:hypothetical protein [Candidatus Marsarchaeota archaeon]